MPRPEYEYLDFLRGDALNEQEIAVLQWAARGDTAAQTGRRLHWSTETIRWNRKRALAKLNARSMPEAVAIALRRGLIQ